jgi:hypothetical protein
MYNNRPIKLQFLPHTKHITQTNWVTLLGEITTIYCDSHKKHI